MIKLKRRAVAAVPKVTNVARYTANRAAENAVKEIAKTKSDNKSYISEIDAKKLTVKAVAAVPRYLTRIGDTGRKLTAAVPRYVNAAAAITEETTEKAKYSTKEMLNSAAKGALYWLEEIDNRNTNIEQRFEAELESYNEKYKRGTTSNGATGIMVGYGGPVGNSALFDEIILLAKYGKIVVDEYPILGEPSRWLQGASEGAAEWVNETSVQVGEQLYQNDGSYWSDFVGGLFRPEAWEENGSYGSCDGSFVRGLMGYGVLGNAKGITDMVAQPFETVEGISGLVGRPEESLPVLWEAVENGWADYVEGSDEYKARVRGAIVFEAASLLYGAGAAKRAGKGAAAAKQGSNATRAARVIDKAGDGGRGIKRLKGLLDDMADSRIVVKAGKSLQGAKVPLRNFMDNFRNSLRFPDEMAELAGTGLVIDNYADTRRLIERITRMADDVPGPGSKVTISKAIDNLDEVPVVGQIKKKLDDIGGKIDDVAGEGSDLRRGVEGPGDFSKIYKSKIKSQSELTQDFFDSLNKNGVINGGRSGEKIPFYSKPNSYTVTDSGHIIIYGDKGSRIMDISSERIKVWKLNTNPKNPQQVTWSHFKLKDSSGAVEKTSQWILDYFN